MPSMLQLGRRYINIDLVCEIEDYGNYVRVFYAVSSSDSAGAPQPSYADLEGAAAEAFRAWLGQNVTLLLTIEEDDRAIEVGRARNAERSRLLQAAETSARTGAEAAGQQDDNAFYGVARLRQMHGAGSDTHPNDADAAASTET